MMPVRLGPSGIFQYNALHGVLICRDCGYAIQKSALQSHLLRHKIYREERQQLLTQFDQFNILEPEDVAIPEPTSLPIDGLDVISGFSCGVSGCGHLCASSKRMRLHQNEAHGLGHTTCADTSFEVKLQTFFRGTKIRYFVVTPHPAAENSRVSKRPITTRQGPTPKNNHEKLEGIPKHSIRLQTTSPAKQLPLLDANEAAMGINVDLKTLNYFHQFFMVTCHTLPFFQKGPSIVQDWQSDVAPLALQFKEHWFMCGVLAIAAHHLAATAHSTDAGNLHNIQAKNFQLVFSTGDRDIEILPESTQIAIRQVRIVLSCLSSLRISELRSGYLHAFLATVRTLAGTDSTYQTGQLVPSMEHLVGRPFSQARQVASDTGSLELSTALDRLESLPARFVEAFGAPGGTENVVSTFASLAFLVDCAALAFKSENISTVFDAMAFWVVEMPQHFQYMISNYNPAALVIVANWVALLVRRAEKCGCWFLRGTASMLLSEIKSLLRPHGSVILDAIAGL